MTHEFTALVGKPWNLPYVVISSAAKREIDPLITFIIRSRGRHDPGSGNYCYGAIRSKTAKLNFVYGGDLVLYPGSRAVLSNTADYRDEVCMIGDTVMRSQAWWRNGRWEYGQNAQTHVYFLPNEYYKFRSYVTGVVPDHFTSSEYIKPEDFPWMPSGGGGADYAYEVPLRLTYSATRSPSQMMAALADTCTLAYDPFINDGISFAYVDACSKAPVNKVNNVANVLAVWKLFTDFAEAPKIAVDVVHSGKELIKSLSNFWLQYRYVLSTTEMDIREMADLAQRVGRGPCNIRCNGYYSEEIRGVKYEFRASFKMTPDDVDGLQSEVEKYGLALTAYNSWDLVPFSFIADWFLRIGDKLEFYEDRNRALRLKPSEIWYSVSKKFETDDSIEDYYFRWSGGIPPIDNSFVQHGDASKATLIKRGADVLALVEGR